jgi:hypothetical protein
VRISRVNEHLLQFEAVRGACSREWQIGETLVMCTELDLAAYAGPPMAPLASIRRRTMPSFLRVIFVRFRTDGTNYSWVDGSSPGELLSAAEQGMISTYQTIIHEWVADSRSGLPPSTTTRVMDRYRSKG